MKIILVMISIEMMMRDAWAAMSKYLMATHNYLLHAIHDFLASHCSQWLTHGSIDVISNVISAMLILAFALIVVVQGMKLTGQLLTYLIELVFQKGAAGIASLISHIVGGIFTGIGTILHAVGHNLKRLIKS